MFASSSWRVPLAREILRSSSSKLVPADFYCFTVAVGLKPHVGAPFVLLFLPFPHIFFFFFSPPNSPQAALQSCWASQQGSLTPVPLFGVEEEGTVLEAGAEGQGPSGRLRSRLAERELRDDVFGRLWRGVAPAEHDSGL